MHCLICTDTITHARMGINACRACAAFFKRTNARFGRLKCKEGTGKCRETNPKASCRKCRLAKFRAVLTRARREDSQSTDEKWMDNDESPQERPSTTFLDHSSFTDVYRTPVTLLDKVSRGYSIMCIIRKSGEIAAKPECKCEGEIQVDDLTLTPATYSSIMPFTRIAKEAMLEFANQAFDEFRSLDDSDKKFIMDSSYPLMNCLEKTYRVCHYFPDEREVVMPGYTTYMRNSEIDKFLADCNDDVDRVNLVREIKRSLDRRVRNVREFFETFELTDIEFLALLSIAFWNEKVMERDEKMQRIGSGIRSEVMNELHCYYSTRGTVEYATRVGNIFCLLENLQKESEKMVEDFRICRLHGMFDNIFTKTRSL